jgi:hypothetical protein
MENYQTDNFSGLNLYLQHLWLQPPPGFQVRLDGQGIPLQQKPAC